MLLEAVWLKEGEEIAKVSPVWDIENIDDGSTLETIWVSGGNSLDLCRCSDLTNIEPDDFIVRVVR